MKNIIYLAVFLRAVTANASESVSWNQSKALPISKVMEVISAHKASELKEYTEVYFDLKVNIQNGQVKQSVVRVYYFPDSASLQNYGTDVIRFTKGIENLSLLRIASISPDGKITEFSHGDLKINDSNSRNTFSSLKEAVFAFPGLEPGNFGIVEFELSQDVSARETDWYKEIYATNFYPRLNVNMNVAWDDSFPMHISSTDKNIQCKQAKGSLSCVGKNLPKVKSDSNVMWSDQLASIQLGQFQNWGQVEEKSNNLFLKSQTPNIKPIESFVLGLLKGETDQFKQISIIHDFVAQKIQYVSMSENGNSHTPHSVLETLQKRRGDCKDKSALFYAMLKVIGVKAYPTLVATDRSKLNAVRIPTMNIFDHMIVCYEYGNGKSGCSELTDNLIEAGAYSKQVQGKVALQLQKNSDIVRLHSDRYRWSADYYTDLKFNKDGGQEEIQTRKYKGEFGRYWRRSIDDKSTDEVQDFFRKDYKENVSSKATVKFDLEGKDDLAADFVVKSKAIFAPFNDPGEDLDYSENDAWLLVELKDSKVPNKIYQYNYTGISIRSTTVWDVSNNWSVLTPPADLNLEHKFGKMIRTVAKMGSGKFKVTTTLEIPQRLVQPSEIEAFNHFVDILIGESSLYVYAKHH